MLPAPTAREIDHRTLKLIVGVVALSLPLLQGGPNLAGVRAAIARQTGRTLAGMGLGELDRPRHYTVKTTARFADYKARPIRARRC